MTRRAVALATLLLLTGCGMRPDSAPHDVPADKARLSVGSSGSNASGAERIYLVEPGEDQLLRSVPRDASDPKELMDILMRGPNPDELSKEYSTAIPSTLQVLSAIPQGSSLYVDVTEPLTELSGQGLLQSLAQIVYTGSEIEGVESVLITVRGEQIAWPKANLEPTYGPLRTYDYPAMVRSAQPAYPSVPSGG